MDKNNLDDLPNPRNESENSGNFLDSSDESYRKLLAALDLGWQVEEPVYFRP